MHRHMGAVSFYCGAVPDPGPGAKPLLFLFLAGVRLPAGNAESRRARMACARRLETGFR